MASRLSPGVSFKEIDIAVPLTAPPGGSRMAYVIESNDGPHDEFVYVTSETDLFNKCGAPTSDRESKDYLYCAQYLLYGNDLVLRRAKSINAKNARVALKSQTGGLGANHILTGTTYLDKKATESHGAATGNKLEFYSRNASSLGNNIQVSICQPSEYTGTGKAAIVAGTYFDRAFEFSPDASKYEIALAVIYNGDIVEKHIVSLVDGTLDDQGNNIYIKDYLLAKSSYIYGFASSDAWTYRDSVQQVSLMDGDSGNSYFDTSSNLISACQTAYTTFKSKPDVAFNYVTEGNHASNRDDVIGIVTTRLDSMAHVGPNVSLIQGVADNGTIVTNLVNDVNSISSASSYVAYYGNIKKAFEQYRKKDFWIPMTADTIGVKVRNNTINEIWTAPAGYNNGGLLNIKQLGFNPDDTQQETLYSNRINHIFSKAGRGTVIFGQKTMLSKNSGFNRVNVRDLFIYVENTITGFAENFLFEINDSITRTQFVNTVTPFLADIQTRRGIIDFRVIADESVNTPAVIDNNEFRASILIKPTKSIEFIELTFKNTPSGVSFTEAAAA